MNKLKVFYPFIAVLIALVVLLVSILPASAQYQNVSELNFSVVKQDDDTDDDPDGDEDLATNYYCIQSDIQHPMGARLAERYGVDYTSLQALFCGGFGWGQIMLALQTGGGLAEAQGLLGLRSEGKGWGQIWQEMGLIGKSRSANSLNDADGDGKPDKPGKSWKNKNKNKSTP